MLESMHHVISQKVSEIFDLYTELHDIRITLFSPDGSLIYPDAVNRPNCDHCRLLREDLGLEMKCRELDHRMMHVAFERQDMITYTCHAGMREVTAPIFVNRELAGYVMLGQFRSESAPEESPYSRDWKKAKGDDALQQAYEQTAVFPEGKIETLIELFHHLLDFIIGDQMIQHKDYDLIAPVIERIREHPEQELQLDEAARTVGRSASTVSRVFKKVTGLSFKQYQVSYRLERAAGLLKSKPNSPVAEIALAVGYDDALYFSRVFRKHFGFSPSEYRQNEGGHGVAPRKPEPKITAV
ncbi:PocR ligand-binding domain-containing protein [Pontiella sp. NLcol2]|uniref:PocR ligand-binding domain-containing protein n=2 Tax=Pontiella agarivorans TaxID=3038953 RepID=A0ABU5N0T5_9BACT|nr:PocR ligand-binding domain-containing protein [Pontiella agarivorans]